VGRTRRRNPTTPRPRRLDVTDAGHDVAVDDRDAQFFVSVGRLCAHLGDLTVCLSLRSGEEIVGVPESPPETEGGDELDGTGYADAVSVGGLAVPLSEVIEASVRRPGSARIES
jgi:hypothetical protein